jgi:hypothetical protein
MNIPTPITDCAEHDIDEIPAFPFVSVNLARRLERQLHIARAALESITHDMGATAAEEIAILRIALADAIRRPMGVIPASAEGRITDEEIRRAEESRVKFKPDGERIHSSRNVESIHPESKP